MQVPMFNETGAPVDITRIEFRLLEGVWRWSMFAGSLPVAQHDVPADRLDDVLHATRLTLHAEAGFPQGFPERAAAPQAFPRL